MQRDWIDDCQGKVEDKTILAVQSDTVKGLVSNGAKVYVTALPTDDIQGAVAELSRLGKASGGTAIG